MKRIAACTAFALVVACATAAVADPILGFSTIEVGGPRPLTLTLWYPGRGGEQDLVAGNAVFEGTAANRDALLVGDAASLILVSHGGLRSVSDSGAWLTSALARAGHLVVEVNGPRPVTAAQAVDEIWHRPNDIGRALDTILDTPAWAERIDHTRISVVGFALGGTAAITIAGGVIDPQSFVQSCAGGNLGPDCGWYAAQNVSLGSVDLVNLATSQHDPRVQATVAIAPEYLHAFSNDLSEIVAPILRISLGPQGGSPVPIDSVLSQISIPTATLFDGFQVCTSAARAILAEDGGDPMLCGVSTDARRRVHDTIALEVLAFLADRHN
ncbi:hypothetical protein A8B78_11195 [Jannaschia sp. EhC01]|nr:hypothetical protein A8B78_11195 [Jannaschia sp. EhC01]